jgi:dTMP kinase
MFITLEGIDGSGKTTQFHRLLNWLIARGHNTLPVREPGGTLIGESARNILHDRANNMMDARTELLLYCASRAQLVAEKIQPHLASGGIVLCDRFADSTMAYQGYGRGLDLDFLRDLLRFATRGIAPDLTIYFALDAEVGIHRRLKGGEEFNRLDAETLDFHKRVQGGYEKLIEAEPARWKVIDASQTIETIARQTQAIVEAHLVTSLNREESK